MFFFDTLVIDKPKQYRKSDPLAWTLLPLLYMVFALINGLVLKWPVPGAKDSPFPYFFINVNRFGWLYVAKMATIIFVAYLLAGCGLFALKRIGKKVTDHY